jgi:hypothetical protein
MGCGCGGAANAAQAEQYVIRFTDGTVSAQKFPDETSARLALARSGRTGVVSKSAA